MDTVSAAPRKDAPALPELLAMRAASYRLFSRLFRAPLDDEEIEALATSRFEERARELGDAGDLARGFNDMGRGLHRRHSGTRHLLATDFTMCFDGIGSLNDERAVPYASVLIGKKTGEDAELFQEPRRADRQAYARERVQADPALNLPDDHLSFELSFMADLSDKIARALASGDAEEAARLVGVSDDFRANHILSWYDRFSALAGQLVQTRFYRGVLAATGGYLKLDGEVLGALREQVAS